MTDASPSRKRVLDALNHRQPDRVPVDFGATSVTGIHVSVVAGLREHYGLERRPVKVHEPMQMLGLVDEDLAGALGVDVAGTPRRKAHFGMTFDGWKPWRLNGLEVLVPGGFNTTTASNGDILLYPQGDLAAAPSGRMPQGGWFFDAIIRQNHFNPENLNPEDNLEEFGPFSEEDVAAIAESVESVAGAGRAVAASFGGTGFGDIAAVPAVGLKDPRGIRDVTEWYVSLRSRRPYIHAVFEKQCEIALANLARVHKAVGGKVDVVYLCGTDFGTQTSAFCSVPTFREMWLPYYKAICAWVHANTTWKCFKHSCGSVERFFESFIEAGFDIINPVQCSAAGMEPAALKAKYGERLVFWGGGVDTQQTLPFGTPEQVREEVLRRCEIFAPGGGFVFNTVHNIQAGTPVRNVAAMLEAVKEFNHG
ncbi:MAG: methyltransferase [Candidatus Solibacter usitatus]|nr:methyltransferase [Candidatus Solibacter usitatus]